MGAPAVLSAGCNRQVSFQRMLRFLGWLFAVGFMTFVAAAAGATYVIWTASKDLPDYTQLANYVPRS